MNISEISGTMVSDPSTATNQIIVDTGDGLQRAIATSAVSGTIVSDESIETTDCIVDTGSGLQKAVKVAGSGGGGGSSTKYGASIDNFLGDVDENGVLQAPSGEADVVFTGVKDLADNALYSRFSSQTNKGETPVKSISFPDLENISGSVAIQNICYYNSYLNSISFPKLKTVTGTYAANNAFNHCDNLTGAVNFPELTSVSGTGIQSGQMGGMFATTKITSISFPKLTTIGSSSTSTGANMSSICSQCKNLAQISFPSLEKIGYSGLSYSFSGCSALTSVIFPSLTNIFYNGLISAFQNCTSLTSISFPSLVSNFNYWGGSSWSRDYSWQNMLQGVTGCTVHFPSNLQAVIGSDTAVTAGFGGTNTTVLFDLPATE